MLPARSARSARSARWLAPVVLVAACCGESSRHGGTTPLREPDAHDVRDARVEAGAPDANVDPPKGRTLRGEASFYADFFNGRQTASGERYDPRKLTAANRTLPLGTRVQITRLDTGRSVIVRVNDRGPFGKRRRIFDLSKAAARQLDMLHVGKAEIEAVILE
ncbi:MAG: septal ring lytic transglycosylase RlpA family protein [Polyangiales bacterium]